MAANRLQLMMQGLGMLPKRLKLDGALRMERGGWGKGLKGKLYFILFPGVPVKSHQNVLPAEQQAYATKCPCLQILSSQTRQGYNASLLASFFKSCQSLNQ